MNGELRKFLLAAQRDVFQGYAGLQTKTGRPITQEGFVKYCGVIGTHKGFQPRDGKHKRGAAIDIDPKFNPYTVTGQDRRNPPFSGETPANFSKGVPSKADSDALDALRQAAMDAYENAAKFVFGKPDMDMSPRSPQSVETAAQIFERFDRVNRAVRVYMTCGFQPTSSNRLAATANVQTRTLDDIRDQIRNAAEDNGFDGGDAPLKTEDRAFLQAFQTQVAQDFAALRKVCVYGSWTIKNGVQNFDFARDPCYGFMTLRQQVVTCLLNIDFKPGRLRWGALDFGPKQSGDMMHFDIGAQANSLQSTTEPNPNGIFFAP